MWLSVLKVFFQNSCSVFFYFILLSFRFVTETLEGMQKKKGIFMEVLKGTYPHSNYRVQDNFFRWIFLVVVCLVEKKRKEAPYVFVLLSE